MLKYQNKTTFNPLLHPSPINVVGNITLSWFNRKKIRGKPMKNTIITRDTGGLRMTREEFDYP